MTNKKSKPKGKFRKFEVWIDKGIPDMSPITETVQLSANATDEECDNECAEVLDCMIANEIDTGWVELE